MKRTEPQKISDILDTIKHSPATSQKLLEKEAIDLWHLTIGDKCSVAAPAINMKNGVLTVKCTSSALRQEITMRRGHLLNIINQSLGKPIVTSIRFI